MLLLLGLFLFPMTFAAKGGELKVNNYIVEIDDCHTLKSIRRTPESTSVLDLSNLGIECVEKDVFQNLDNVKTLSLANNALYGVPAAVFANLTNLEHLSLAGNKMERFENTFIGLENLKTLDISDLPMRHLYDGYLYGLTKSTDIIVLNNRFSSLYTDTFTKGPNYDEPLNRKRRSAGTGEDENEDPASLNPESRETTTSSMFSSLYTDTFTKGPNYDEPLNRKRRSAGTGEDENEDPASLNPESRETTTSSMFSSLYTDTFTKGPNYDEPLNRKRRSAGTGEDENEDPASLNPESSETTTSSMFSSLYTDTFTKGPNYDEPLNRKRRSAGTGGDENEDPASLNPESRETTTSSMFSSLYTDTFTKGPNYDEPLNRKRRSAGTGEDDNEDPASLNPESRETTTTSMYDPQRVQICIQDGVLSRVESLENNEKTLSGCIEKEVLYWAPALNLEYLNITGFESGWYRRKPRGISGFTGIHLKGNNIVRITSELFNDLPEDVNYVGLAGNKIERLDKDVIENSHVTILDLSDNFISEIEDGSLENTKLTGLYLTKNRLKDTKFAATLPSTLTTLKLDNNGIEELTPGSFSKLENLENLNLQHNNITNLKTDSLQGLSSLNILDINDNALKTIESGSFGHLKKIQSLILSKNKIDSFDEGVFDGIESSFVLNLASNKFTKITKDTFANMSENLVQLYLDNNEIERVESGGFAKLAIQNLALNGNRISKIEEGSFDLPELEILSMNGNSLGKLDSEIFQGLANLTSLTVSFNGITKIEKGSMRYLENLQFLDIAGNPIKRLDNGALFGLRKDPPVLVSITKGSLEILQGGVFDDV